MNAPDPQPSDRPTDVESTVDGEQSADGHDDDNPPESSNGATRTARIVAVVVGVAFVGLMTFAAVRLLGPGAGGSGSPEEAVQELARAEQ